MPKLTKNKTNYCAIGLMSGTSLDGVDLALCDYTLTNNNWKFKCLRTLTVNYPPGLIDQLIKVTTLSGEEVALLDLTLGQWYGARINELLSKNNISPDFIASHGHTVFHQPEKHFTYQIGNGWAIHQATNIPVINDFRSKDVALGGQGAPLVPIGDMLLFNDYDCCINLGGIANISADVGGQRVAYDIAPCNMVLNRLAGQFALAYDENGKIARSGTVITSLLEQLDHWHYYRKPYPKSLGYEQVNNEIFPIVDNPQFKAEDILATYVSHLATQIAACITAEGRARVLVTGGGTYNQTLIEALRKKIPKNACLEIPKKEFIDFKEAIVFGFLGVLRARNEVNCLSSVTGASSDSCGGVIYE